MTIFIKILMSIFYDKSNVSMAFSSKMFVKEKQKNKEIFQEFFKATKGI